MMSNYPRQHRATNSQSQKPFSPCLTTILKIKAESTFYLGAGICIYSQKHNMIIFSPGTPLVYFYDAGTLEPIKGRDKLECNGSVTRISFWPETDCYVLGCSKGETYLYNASNKRFKKLETSSHASTVLSLAFISPEYYVFSLWNSEGISIGNIENQDLPRTIPQNGDSYSIYYSKNQKVLFSGATNSNIIGYRTDQLPKLSKICSFKAHQGYIKKIEGAKISNKEYIITCGGQDHRIIIWHLIKGRMKRIRTIIIGEMIHDLAYLEDYKMLAVTSERFSQSVKFFTLISGKLEFTLKLKVGEASCLFVMKDKNSIGVTDDRMNSIKIVQLGPS